MLELLLFLVIIWLVIWIIYSVTWLLRRLFSPRTDDSINRGTAHAVKGECDRATRGFKPGHPA